MVHPPSDIKLKRADGQLLVTWSPVDVASYPLKFLRTSCQCAGCVDEYTGERILDPGTVPESIEITNLQLVGSYALRISWSDGHDSGIYSWKLLRALQPPGPA